MQYSVKLDAFEGPLDLLLHLIKRMEIDIYDIPVSKITDQYLLYIQTMNELELDVASEYLVMAATLIAIKSKMLLPNPVIEDENDEHYEPEIDPLEELVQQLIEYKRYKEVAQDLQGLESERMLIFTKAPDDLSEFIPDLPPVPQNDGASVYDMLAAFQKLLRRQKLQKPLQTRIARQDVSVDKRMDEVIDILRQSRERVLFTSLFSSRYKDHLIVTFLAILELMKMNKIYVEQENNLDDIIIQLKEETI